LYKLKYKFALEARRVSQLFKRICEDNYTCRWRIHSLKEMKLYSRHRGMRGWCRKKKNKKMKWRRLWKTGNFINI